MNWIKSLAFLGAVLIGHSWAQTSAKTGRQTAPPPPSEASISRVGNAVHVSVNGPRPLERAVDALRLKYGWLVSYEDPQYLSAKDLTESAGEKGFLQPAGGAFTADIPVGEPPADAPPEDKSLKLVVDAYNRSGNPGQFELRRSDDGAVAVAGVAARDEKGTVSAQKVLLDSMITVPVEQRTIADTVNLICQKLADETHLPVAVGVTPRSLVDHINVKAGGTKSPARTVLSQALAASDHPLYWRLLFDPNSKGYLLNIHWLRAQKEPGHETPMKPPHADAHP